MKKKVLQVAYHSLANGGIQAVIMGIVRNLWQDIDFDIVLFSGSAEYYDDEFLKYGKIFRIPIREKRNKFLNTCEHFYRWAKIFLGTYKILKKRNYYAIHCHNEEESGICTLAARLAGVKIRISHAHNTASPQKGSYLNKIYKALLNPLIRLNSNIRIGCSKGACDYMFGRDDRSAIVINNAIDMDKFSRKDNKKAAGDKSIINFVHIGRFCYQKNQLFLLEIFSLIKQKLNNSCLTLVGFGEDQEMIKKRIMELELEDCTKLLPHNTNIPQLLENMDYMIFPSRFEGLGIVLLEAQVMGVTCFPSDVVPREADMGLCNFIPLDKGADVWAQNIIDYISNHKSEAQKIPPEVKRQYDIKEIAKQYKNIYHRREWS